MAKRSSKARKLNRKLGRISKKKKLAEKNLQTKEMVLGNLEALRELDEKGEINFIE